MDLNHRPTVYETVALPLSYDGEERATGIEPVTAAWKAEMLPLHHARRKGTEVPGDHQNLKPRPVVNTGL